MNITPNAIVAFNLREARRRRQLTQEQAAERLEPHLGTRWSPASFSAAERGRKRFTIDEVYAFTQTFELPIAFFLTPPKEANTVGTAGEPIHVGDFLEAVFNVGDEDTREHLRSATLSGFSLQDARGIVERYAESWRSVGAGAGAQILDEALRRVANEAEIKEEEN